MAAPQTVSAPSPSPQGGRPKPALRVELLFYLTFLVAFALLVGVATSLLTLAMAPESGVLLVIILIAVEVAIFVLYGRWLVSRLVLRPLDRVMQAADAVADGDLGARAPGADTRDFATLAERLNRMTERLLDAQSQLVRSEKLASIGRLAAGVAHEVGNPLGAIGTYVEVLRRRGADQEVTEGMANELERLDRIVRSLLDYARPQEDPLVPVDPSRIVRGAFELLRAQGAFRAVNANTDIFPHVPEIAGRAHVLQQALVNLLLNAVDATPPGGTIVIGVRRWAYEPGRSPPKRNSDPGFAVFPRAVERRPARMEFAAGQPGALVFVADAGPGIAPADREKVFEPFYTTKDPGRGTGLGLAIVARTVYEMGGVVWVDAAREGGAAFKLFFPVAVPAYPLSYGAAGSVGGA
ncbi:MAG TPA: HAMP domain-containing sensor histidine kinase [Gemmatimonadales bacterium]|nr:HAMP domain-containing sensor histidine kinase [Gemmatimonadales bacterium]